ERHLVSAGLVAAQALRRLPAAARARQPQAVADPVPSALRVRAAGGGTRWRGAAAVRRPARADGAAERARQGRGGGRPGWWLRRAELVDWSDLFDGNGAVRHFDEVVRWKHLTVEPLLGVGIPEAIARRAVGLGLLGR